MMLVEDTACTYEQYLSTSWGGVILWSTGLRYITVWCSGGNCGRRFA